MKSENDYARCSAAHSLGRLGDPRAIEALRPLLNDNVSRVKDAAVCALAKLGDASCFYRVADMLQSGNKDERRYAVRVLSDMRSQQAIARLIETLNDHEAKVRNDAADALTKITGKSFYLGKDQL